MNKLNQLRRKAYSVGCEIQKGYRHYITKDYPVYRDENGDKVQGYNVRYMSTNTLAHGCYNEVYDHLWDLDDVENFLMEI